MAAQLYEEGDAWRAAQVDAWLEAGAQARLSRASLAALLEAWLASRTFLVGHRLSLADIAVCVALQLRAPGAGAAEGTEAQAGAEKALEAGGGGGAAGGEIAGGVELGPEATRWLAGAYIYITNNQN